MNGFSDCTIAEKIHDFNFGQIIKDVQKHVKDTFNFYIDNPKLDIIYNEPQRHDQKCVQFTEYDLTFNHNDYTNLPQYHTRKQEWILRVELVCYALSPDDLTQFAATLGLNQLYEENKYMEYLYVINRINITDFFINEKRGKKTVIQFTVSPKV